MDERALYQGCCGAEAGAQISNGLEVLPCLRSCLKLRTWFTTGSGVSASGTRLYRKIRQASSRSKIPKLAAKTSKPCGAHVPLGAKHLQWNGRVVFQNTPSNLGSHCANCSSHLLAQPKLLGALAACCARLHVALLGFGELLRSRHPSRGQWDAF